MLQENMTQNRPRYFTKSTEMPRKNTTDLTEFSQSHRPSTVPRFALKTQLLVNVFLLEMFCSQVAVAEPMQTVNLQNSPPVIELNRYPNPLSSRNSSYDWSTIPNDKNQYLDIPDIGGGGVGLINRNEEQQIGEKVLREVRAKLPVLQDAWLEDELSQVFGEIYGQSNLGAPIALVVIRDEQINAFAVPGGLFAINAGLLTTAKNMDEVAGVMAHEIAHVTQRHFSRSKENFKGQGLLTLAGILAGIAVASQSPDAGAAVMLGSQAAMLDRQLSYSREQEREADRVGMQYMAIAGYNPESMADFFETMHRKTSQLSFLPDFWLTHPLTTDRMSEARLRARQYQYKSNQYTINHQGSHKNTQQDLFEMMRWRVAVLSGYVNLTQLKSMATRNHGAALALAHYYIEQSQYADAKKILDNLSPSAVEKTLYQLTWSAWYVENKQYQQALDAVLPLYRVMPEHRALAMQVADIYILQGQGDQAHQILNKLSQSNPRDVAVWQALQRAETVRSKTAINQEFQAINGLRYRAEAQFWSGQEENAIKSMLHAERLAMQKNNESLQSRITVRLKAMQDAHQLNL
ncbi:Putative Zn-dependent protease, contains TPR repeats [Acinetobacter marinus]|uniref:Putative beta-barrel assembly-enhancing protease n=2 Tax=Acinetobacter marinus TaxID=281375 RepID=A0A1G6H247_9GAMM|nr:Putative Zn-dependent protease, contains TPR repeats [Acinetobacter marinus]